MCVVNFDRVESGLESPLHRSSPRGLEILDVLKRHFLWCGMMLVICDRRRCIDIIGPSIQTLIGNSTAADPRSYGRGFTSSMSELDDYMLILRVCEFDCLGQGCNLAVLPQSAVFGSDPPLSSYGGRLDAGKAWTALQYPTQVSLVP